MLGEPRVELNNDGVVIDPSLFVLVVFCPVLLLLRAVELGKKGSAVVFQSALVMVSVVVVDLAVAVIVRREMPRHEQADE